MTIEHDFDDVIYYIPEEDRLDTEPRWTKRRVVMLLIALVMIGTLLVYTLAPLLQHLFYQPPLPTIPLSQI